MIFFLGFITLIANISNTFIYYNDINNGSKLMAPSAKLADYTVVSDLMEEE
jgi:hypothetical protein